MGKSWTGTSQKMTSKWPIKHMKRSPTSFLFRKMQNKTAAGYYQPTRMAKNKSLTITNVDDDREQVRPIQH